MHSRRRSCELILEDTTPFGTVYGRTVAIIDFAEGDTVPEFNVGPGNHFVCVPDIPLGILQQVKNFRNLEGQITETGDLEPILRLFDELLDESSAQLFRMRVADKTIGVKRISKIIPWILEEYGMDRPTQPSSPSLTGSSDGETGSSSPAGAPSGVLMLGGQASQSS
jgi:hypothetical protein